MTNVNSKLSVAKSELDVLILAVKEGRWSEEEVLEKLKGITATIESAMKENLRIKNDLLMLAKSINK